MAEVQQGFCLISISLYNAKYLDHLSYSLKIVAFQGLGQSWDVMQGITNTTTTITKWGDVNLFVLQ